MTTAPVWAACLLSLCLCVHLRPLPSFHYAPGRFLVRLIASRFSTFSSVWDDSRICKGGHV